MRTFAKVSLAILLMAVLAWASDPWKSKPYQDWDQKDIAKVLNHSPWVKSVTVTAKWESQTMSPRAPTNTAGPDMGQQRGGATMGHPNMGASEPNMSGGLPGGNSIGGGARPQRQVGFIARWVSAKTMREALARMEVLRGKMAQPGAERYIEQTPSTYEIVVYGQDLTPFEKLDKASIARNSHLDMSKSKQKYAPTNVKFDRQGNRLVAVAFFFPKTADGKPTIGPDEKGVELVCKLKDATLKFHFDPRKMTTKQGRDL